MFEKFAIASLPLLLALPFAHNRGPAPSIPVYVGDTITVKLSDQIGFLYSSECGITPEPTFPSSRTQRTLDGVRTYSKLVTEVSGTVVSVTDSGFTVRCLTTVDEHEGGPRMVSVTSTFRAGGIQTTTIRNPIPLVGPMRQARPTVVEV